MVSYQTHLSNNAISGSSLICKKESTYILYRYESCRYVSNSIQSKQWNRNVVLGFLNAESKYGGCYDYFHGSIYCMWKSSLVVTKKRGCVPFKVCGPRSFRGCWQDSRWMTAQLNCSRITTQRHTMYQSVKQTSKRIQTRYLEVSIPFNVCGAPFF